MWDFVDKVVYINLDSRQDRRDIMDKFFNDAQIPNDKIMRFSAIKEKAGTVGCCKSHIEVLKLAIEKQWDRVMILEDDITIINPDTAYTNIKNIVENQKFDVLLMSGTYGIAQNGDPVLFSWCTSGYIVNRHYYSKLLKNYQDGLCALTGNTDMIVYDDKIEEINAHPEKHIDAYWGRLSRCDNWIGVWPKPIFQLSTFSDVINDFRTWHQYFPSEYPFKQTNPE